MDTINLESDTSNESQERSKTKQFTRFLHQPPSLKIDKSKLMQKILKGKLPFFEFSSQKPKQSQQSPRSSSGHQEHYPLSHILSSPLKTPKAKAREDVNFVQKKEILSDVSPRASKKIDKGDIFLPSITKGISHKPSDNLRIDIQALSARSNYSYEKGSDSERTPVSYFKDGTFSERSPTEPVQALRSAFTPTLKMKQHIKHLRKLSKLPRHQNTESEYLSIRRSSQSSQRSPQMKGKTYGVSAEDSKRGLSSIRPSVFKTTTMQKDAKSDSKDDEKEQRSLENLLKLLEEQDEKDGIIKSEGKKVMKLKIYLGKGEKTNVVTIKDKLRKCFFIGIM